MTRRLVLGAVHVRRKAMVLALKAEWQSLGAQECFSASVTADTTSKKSKTSKVPFKLHPWRSSQPVNRFNSEHGACGAHCRSSSASCCQQVFDIPTGTKGFSQGCDVCSGDVYISRDNRLCLSRRCSSNRHPSGTKRNSCPSHIVRQPVAVTCRVVEHPVMARCQNASCDIAWFHATNAPRKSCRGNLDRQE